jgi:hypothetical protein
VTEDVKFDQVGWINDGDGGWTVYECSRCAALITASRKRRHADWHEQIAAGQDKR